MLNTCVGLKGRIREVEMIQWRLCTWDGSGLDWDRPFLRQHEARSSLDLGRVSYLGTCAGFLKTCFLLQGLHEDHLTLYLRVFGLLT